MKLFASIFFLLITVVYTLSVKEIIADYMVTCIADMEKQKIEEKKEEKAQKHLSFILPSDTSSELQKMFAQQHLLSSCQFLHCVETPPPDFI